MKIKRLLIIIFVLLVIITASILLYNDYRIKNAKIIVNLKDELKAEVYSKVKISDFIEDINGKIVNDKKIDTSEIGVQTETFEFINEDNIQIAYSFDVEIVDKTPPLISGKNTITLHEGYDENILDNFLCGDNYDDKVKCEITGNYDTDKIGSYPVTLIAKDSSGNTSTHDFTIKIVSNEKYGIEREEYQTYTHFKDVISKYKNKKNKIGIDVSKWEGDIEYKKVKEEGAEFAYIRIGYRKAIGGDFLLDPKFKQNYEGFKKQNIKVGVYFYSKANSKKEAVREAEWIVENLKGYKLDLEVVFDWENWDGYNEYKQSFYNLTQTAKTFMSYLEKSGYKTMNYSSKYYLENVWFDTNRDIWLAHYTENTDYKGKYKVWQLCENGKIDGINDTVDIDIMNEVW